MPDDVVRVEREYTDPRERADIRRPEQREPSDGDQPAARPPPRARAAHEHRVRRLATRDLLRRRVVYAGVARERTGEAMTAVLRRVPGISREHCKVSIGGCALAPGWGATGNRRRRREDCAGDLRSRDGPRRRDLGRRQRSGLRGRVERGVVGGDPCVHDDAADGRRAGRARGRGNDVCVLRRFAREELRPGGGAEPGREVLRES